MNLINFLGLNCYQNSIVSVASFLGVDYQSAFATLWSETDFRYDYTHKMYLSKRLITNLEVLGAKLENLNCSSTKKSEESLSLFQVGEWIILGIDAFHIPWNQYYHTLSGPHYFIARKEKADLMSCFDPTYNQKYMQILLGDITPYIFDICRLYKVEEKPLNIGVMQETQEVIGVHPYTQKKLLEAINECTCGKEKNAHIIAKYINAMINNRYIYKHYLQNSPITPDKNNIFFNERFFLRWKSVKNGLYKASLINNNESIISEVCEQFNNLIEEEIDTAQKMLAK